MAARDSARLWRGFLFVGMDGVSDATLTAILQGSLGTWGLIMQVRWLIVLLLLGLSLLAKNSRCPKKARKATRDRPVRQDPQDRSAPLGRQA
jgi:uncharacterized membrane protein